MRAALERHRLASEDTAMRLASETKDRFLAVLSHELRTPLTPILLTLDTLERSSQDPAQRGLLEMIRRNLRIETRLIDDLLDVIRIEREKLHLAMSRVDVHETIRDAVEMCRDDLDDRSLTLRLDADEPYVHGDATRLSQVFWNLLRNAARCTPRGGNVRVVTSRQPATGAFRVEISDNGRGIAREDLERIFEPFEQASGSGQESAGLGLGLAICRGLVQAHGGSIRAESPGPGMGATFTVELPYPAQALDPQRAEPKTPRASGGVRVLVVEDNRDTAEALRLLLRIHGFDVEIAHSVGEARKQLETPFDVLISDIQLPDGSGLELMRGLGAKTRGIAMSGFGAKADLERSREAGFHAHLVKPVPIEKVLEAIQAAAPRPGV